MHEGREIKEGSRYDASEGEMERFAAQLLATAKLSDELTVAKQIAEDAPKSVGGASLLRGRIGRMDWGIEAIQALSKTIELSPTPRALLLQMEQMRDLSNLEKALK